MNSPDDQIPFVETYRGVGIHDQQPKERIEGTVKPEIDHVFEHKTDTDLLLAWAGNFGRSPESRLLAGAFLKAVHKLETDQRKARTGLDPTYIDAIVSGLASRRCRLASHYGALFSAGSGPGGTEFVKREFPLPANYNALARDFHNPSESWQREYRNSLFPGLFDD